MDAVSHLKWFREPHDTMSSEIIRGLSDLEFRVWSAMKCLASKSPPQDRLEGALTINPTGHPLPLRSIHVETWTSSDEETTQRAIDGLFRQGLVEQREDGAWRLRMWWHQYPTDTSTARVRKHRAMKGTPPGQGPPSELQMPETSASEPHERFEEFWSCYGYKVKKKDAIAAFNKAVDGGADVDVILAKASEYDAWCVETEEMRAQPASWLEGERWTDEY